MADAIAPRVACVTGVSRGLGAALAAELVARNFEVVGLGRSAHASLAGPRFRLVSTDLADLAQLDAIAASAFAAIAAQSPAFAVLINNAATAAPAGLLGTLAAAEIAHAFAVNLVAPVILANAFVRALAGRVPARVIDVSSGSAVNPLSGTVAYCAAKAGLEMASKVGAAEAPAGVDFVVIRPGIIDTPMQEFVRSRSPDALPAVGMFREWHASGALQSPEDTARRIVERVVLGEQVSGAVLRYQEL
jgi:NAD(P)-dependent dehydrogenase (short-subunit alcohol dehydrogenase family)